MSQNVWKNADPTYLDNKWKVSNKKVLFINYKNPKDNVRYTKPLGVIAKINYSSKYLVKPGVIRNVFIITCSDAKKSQYVLSEDLFYVGTKTPQFQSCVNDEELEDVLETHQNGTWFKKVINRLTPGASSFSGYSTDTTVSPAQPRVNKSVASSSSSSGVNSSAQPWDRSTNIIASTATSSNENIVNNPNSTIDSPKNPGGESDNQGDTKDQTYENEQMVDIGGGDGEGT